MGEPTIERCRHCGASPLPASRLTWATPVCIKCVRKTHDEWAEENASLERDLARLTEKLELAEEVASHKARVSFEARRDLAELREAARALGSAYALYRRTGLLAGLLDTCSTMAALLPAEPPKEASDGK